MIASLNAARSSTEVDRIETLLRSRLRDSGYYTLRRISCELDGNVLRLDGRVSSYYEKQLAQSLVLQHLNGRAVLECLEVLERLE